MAEESSGGDNISKLRAWATPFATSVLLGLSSKFYDKSETEALEYYKVIAPFLGGAISYLIGLGVSHLADSIDKNRYTNNIFDLEMSLHTIEDEEDENRENYKAVIEEIKRYKSKLSDIRSKSFIR